MNIIDKVANQIVKKYKEQTLSLLNSEDEFLTAFATEYTVVESKLLEQQHMITNIEALYANIPKDVETLQKLIKEKVINKLYTDNYISAEEFQKLCQNKKEIL